jgi:murein DD-endopeptidase MepM/ murein hydrolase activator NlpD/3D (Asp-Asp-Asp) domain-containing protein/peptidoglycan hydrolase-like protein with peptidoglycan-binding domain
MTASEEKNWALRPQPLEGLESPFLAQELFMGQGDEEWETRLGALEGESPFLSAFQPGVPIVSESEEQEAEYADDKFTLTEWRLETTPIDIVCAGDRKKGTAVLIKQAPAVFLPAIIARARDRALRDKKNDLAQKLDPATWFKQFTRVTFLGRPLRDKQYLHLEMAKLLKYIESEMIRKYGGDAKSVGDMLLKGSQESIAGSRLVSSTAVFSMHMFGVAIDVNYLGNPYIETENDVKALNNVLRNAALLMNQPVLAYKKEYAKDKFDQIQRLDDVLEGYFSLLDAPVELERLVQASASSEWRGLSWAEARDKIQKNLDNLAGWLERGNTPRFKRKDYFKKHGILNFDKRFVVDMEAMGLSWGGHYGDNMHFDMRSTGVGAYIQKERTAYQEKAREFAKRLHKEGKYGTYVIKPEELQEQFAPAGNWIESDENAGVSEFPIGETEYEDEDVAIEPEASLEGSYDEEELPYREQETSRDDTLLEREFVIPEGWRMQSEEERDFTEGLEQTQDLGELDELSYESDYTSEQLLDEEASPAATPAAVATSPAPARLSAERVRFVQRVLNVAEGERLKEDGDLGSRTRAALERFRAKYGLGAGGALDVATELGLAQRALEELTQASMFAQIGTRDARTEQALITFKTTRKLGANATIDAATRLALADALGRMASKPQSTTHAPRTQTSSVPSNYLGGKLLTFTAKTVVTPVAVFAPQATLPLSEVDMLVYAHGLLHPCPGPKSFPDGIITSAPFKLGDIVAASGRPIVLVVPLLDWANPGGESAFGSKARRNWHALAKPDNLNSLVSEVMAELGRVQGTTPPSLRNLVIAGHSRAYDFLEPLAYFHSDPHMKQGALAELSEVWAFDTTYGGGNVKPWTDWLADNKRLKVTVIYRPGGRESEDGRPMGTWYRGDKFYKKQGGRLKVERVTNRHCDIPAAKLPTLLNPGASREDGLELYEPDPESEFYAPDMDDREAAYGRNYVDEEFEDESEEMDDLTDEQDLLDEPELEALAFEAMGSADENAFDDQEDELESEEEFEEEYDTDYLLERETPDKPPLPVPVGNPVPFAPTPPYGSYWPVITSIKDARLVSYMYEAPNGIIGKPGRRFLADRQHNRRWHVGIDLFANKGDVVVACEDGTIVGFSHFYNAKSGQPTNRLLVQHDSGVVVNYGEVTRDSLRRNGLAVGARVQAGQPIAFVGDTWMLHFETYTKGTTTSHRWMKDEKTPPPQLLNPTRYLLFLREHGLSSSQKVGGKSASTPTSSRSSKPPEELVIFAQRVLNATESTQLDEDGDLGRYTRAALEQFRARYNLGSGGVLDDATVLALAQRALEELAQQSMFAQPGLLDAHTREAISTFKSERGLGFNATVDAATRAALTDALRHRANTPSMPPPVVTSSGLPKLGAGVTPPADPNAYRRFRLTTYHVVDQRDVPTGAVQVPIYGDDGRKVAEGSPKFFAQLSLEGSARLADGRLINVTGKKVPVSHADYAEVLAYHRQAYAGRDKKRREQGKPPTPTAYSGIEVKDDRVVRAFAFYEVSGARRGIGYGTQRGIPLVPFRTLAADIGYTKYGKVDPKWKGKGGLVPPGTHVYIKEYDGFQLPDGTQHDGWFIVNDTGGAIFGAHFDVFVDTSSLGKQVKLPAFGQVWFAGIEQRIPPGYTYGLEP